MTIPRIMPFEAIVCGHCGLKQFPRPHCARCHRQLGLRYFGFEMPRDLNHACLPQLIGSLVHDLRLRRKMSQAALGQTSAVNRSMISRLENGHAVSLMVLLRLAAGLGVEEIYFRVGNARSKSG